MTWLVCLDTETSLARVYSRCKARAGGQHQVRRIDVDEIQRGVLNWFDPAKRVASALGGLSAEWRLQNP